MKRIGMTMIVALAVWCVLLVPSAPVMRAQYQDASAEPAITTGDPRSDGGGPGLVGSPIEIAVGIVMLGLLTIGGTVLVTKATRR